MAELKLSNSEKVAIVDDELFDFLNAFRWYLDTSGNYEYARTSDRSNTRLHIMIMGKREGLMIDHENHNTLDNRRANLKFVTNSQNQHNRKKQGKGVTFCNTSKRYIAYAYDNGRRIYLGRHETEEQALVAKEQHTRSLR